jgi:hypothetical protein
MAVLLCFRIYPRTWVPGVPVTTVYVRLQVKLLFTAAFCIVQAERRLPYAGNKYVHLKRIMGGQQVLPNTGGQKNAKTDLPMEAVQYDDQTC